MSVERKRGCGYRKVDGLYLIGGLISAHCDRLPIPLEVCPTCGGGVKVGRGFTKINAFKLWGDHDKEWPICTDKLRPCMVCDPVDDVAFIMRVGEKFYPTPKDFVNEGIELGISKRIAFIPDDLVIGKTVIFLAHIKAVKVEVPAIVQQAMDILEEGKSGQPQLMDADHFEYKDGVFASFIPQRIEKICRESDRDNEEKMAALAKRNITPVFVPDNDPDHCPVKENDDE